MKWSQNRSPRFVCILSKEGLFQVIYFSNVNTDTNVLFIKNNVFLRHRLPFSISYSP